MSDDNDDDFRQSEDNRFGGRVRRYARVGASAGKLATRLAVGKVFGGEVDHGRYAADLTAALGGLKGPLMKVAQILSTIPDALPRDYADALAGLQADAPPMGWLFVKRRMRTELGAGWQEKFADFGKDAAAAASLGQVHKATLPDGRDVACKLQYPDMAATVEADLKQLRAAFAIYRRYDSAIDAENIQLELAARLREELDYEREARQMALYGHMLRDEAHVHVPEPVMDLTSRRLLTMTWLQGGKLQAFVDRNPTEAERNQVALNMFRAWYVPFYKYGVIHGDPHLGNYSLRDDLSVNLLDFGCIRVFQPGFVEAVISLYHALRDNDRDRAVAAYESWGFTNLSNELIDVLNIWAGFVYGPLLDDRERKMEESNSVAYGAEVAGKVHAELRRLGGVKPPREFVLVDRAAVGLGSVFLRLDAKVNWYRIFHDLVQDFDVAKLAQNQNEALEKVGLERPE
ncbi:AarF/ABC1/UbiB kinase family protein [Thalassospira sp. TSL5-1]|uniref:ABC1 kinase family protein n=1 Tax=Thalassospira sp. TSL5-1 TaxID=1544451 RepID=UPI000939071B|nr:AarF/ABC1/UbiB kinase family protein [Thalassospira sp. TSL5-1]OKH88430.1 ABC transporter ATP-binding protein [Thalassospira sp. TSL5-1]